MSPVLSPPTAAVPRTRHHLYWIDWMRFLAAFVVLADHVRAFNWYGLTSYTGEEHSPALAAFISLTSLGRQAVVVFFVLSGWLVGGVAAARVRAGTFDAAGYAADRLSRVYVPLVPALLFTLAVVRSLDGHPQPMQYLVCLVGLQDVSGILKPVANTALWTLGYEVWFYVLAGCAAVALRRGGAAWTRLVGVAGTALAVGICIGLGWVYLACWLVGVAGPWLRDRLAPMVRPWTAAVGLLVMATGAGIYQINGSIVPPPTDDYDPTVVSSGQAQLILAVGTLLLAASLSSMAPRTRVGRRIERAGGWAAAFSYTLYLVHLPVLGALRACLWPLPAVVNAPSILRGCGWGAVCVAVALGMYALFERQTPRVRRWLRARLARETSPANLPPATADPRLATAR